MKKNLFVKQLSPYSEDLKIGWKPRGLQVCLQTFYKIKWHISPSHPFLNRNPGTLRMHRVFLLTLIKLTAGLF
jgi:hypothetical protein